MKQPIGLVLKQIADEKKISAVAIQKKLGKSRQHVYNGFAKIGISDEEKLDWASALNVTVEEIDNRWNSTSLSNKSVDSGTFGQEVLDKVIEELKNQYEARIHELKDQIGDLREQLKFNREMVQAFKEGQLGKSKGTPNGQIAGYLND